MDLPFDIELRKNMPDDDKAAWGPSPRASAATQAISDLWAWESALARALPPLPAWVQQRLRLQFRRWRSWRPARRSDYVGFALLALGSLRHRGFSARSIWRRPHRLR